MIYSIREDGEVPFQLGCKHKSGDGVAGTIAKGLQVIYAGDEYLQPDAVAHEIQGKSSDINAGFGGK